MSRRDLTFCLFALFLVFLFQGDPNVRDLLRAAVMRHLE